MQTCIHGFPKRIIRATESQGVLAWPWKELGINGEGGTHPNRPRVSATTSLIPCL